MRKHIVLGFVALFSLSSLALSVFADEEKIALDKVPAAVKEAVKKKFPKAEMKEAAKEVENGKTVYEISIKDGETAIDVSLSDEGKILAIEKEMAVADLPAAVKDAVKTKYAEGMITKAEEITKEETVSYEVIVKNGDKNRELGIDAKGKITSDEEAGKD